MLPILELYWAAGFLEGEGCFHFGPKAVYVTATQVQRQPLERLLALFGGTIQAKRKSRTPNAQDFYRWTVGGTRGAGIAMMMWTLMSPRRREQIEVALAKWKQLPPSRSNIMRVTGHCASGHKMTPENTGHHSAGYRFCRICKRNGDVAYRKNRRAAGR